MRRFLILATLLALAPVAAFAHAQLIRAVPPVGATVRSAPPEIVLSFSEPVEAALSTLELRDAAGKKVERGAPRVGGDGRQLAVAVGTLPPGTYKVVWKVTSIDSHTTQGDFTFQVAP
jgi:methionine-rich copper-binding protein CopC